MASVPVARATPGGEVVWHAFEVCERTAALVLLVALSPAMAAAAVAIVFDSRRGPLIAHRRIGFHGETLWMYKLRTMWNRDAAGPLRWIEYVEDDGGYAQKHAADPRVGNWLARFCRRHSIDELPQLWHVVRGEMALIGPRPMTAAEIRQHYGRCAAEVLGAKPGITGLWQTSGRNRLTYEERCSLDLRFVRSRTPAMYWRILYRTLAEICTGANSY